MRQHAMALVGALLAVGLTVTALPTASAAAPAPPAPRTDRISVTPDGAEGDAASRTGALSANGRYAAFGSSASNLVPGDTNGTADAFVRDLRTGAVDRVNLTDGGAQSTGGVQKPSISDDGRYVAFASLAGDLVPGDTNKSYDIFVHDRKTGHTERVSKTAERATRPPYDLSLQPVISGNGRFVAFYSNATDLVPGDTNQRQDVFLYDRRKATTERVSDAPDGTQGDHLAYAPYLSPDGRYVTFMSASSNLVPGDTNDGSDMFVRDRRKGTVTRVSVGTGGVQSEGGGIDSGEISDNGRYAAFTSSGSNLAPDDHTFHTEAFVHDLKTGRTWQVSVATDGTRANGHALTIAISGDGRRVFFDSYADNLVPDDTNALMDVFSHDLRTGRTQRVSVSTAGAQATGTSSVPATDAHGRKVIFGSDAPDLVPGDGNAVSDTFIHRRP